MPMACTMAEISDVRQVTDFQVTVAGIRIMVAADARMVASGGRHKLAVVAEENVAFGMSRMYQTLGEPNIRSVGVFRNYKEAEDWLGTA
jgi:Iap family predicted aminopeptidase